MSQFGKRWNRILNSPATYKVVAFLILLGMIVGAFNGNKSYAWFTDSSSVPFTLDSGKVHYEVTYTTSGGLMVPGKNLFTGFKLTNKSTIDTNVRLQVQYTVWEEGASGGTPVSSTVIYTTNAALNASTTAIDGQYLNLSLKRGADGFTPVEIAVPGEDTPSTWLNYRTTVAGITIPEGSNVDDVSGTAITVFEDPFQFCYDGPKTKNVFEGRPVTVTIKLQAKQADHVTWEELTMVETFE